MLKNDFAQKFALTLTCLLTDSLRLSPSMKGEKIVSKDKDFTLRSALTLTSDQKLICNLKN